MFWINDDPNWRTSRTSGWWEVDAPIGDGSFSLQVIDPVDGFLSNSTLDQVVLQGVGMRGDARHILSVILNPSVPNTTPALDVLRTGIHSALDFLVNPSATLTVSGAPASTNAQMILFGILLSHIAPASEYHARAAMRAGATKKELHDVAGLAFLFRGLPAFNLAAEVLNKIFVEQSEDDKQI